MPRKWIFTIVSLVLTVALVSAQSGQCTDVIQTAIANAGEECSGIIRNQACFGHIALTATGQPDATGFEFADVGDVVDVAAIQTLTLGGFNSDTGAWGVVLMQLQANLPNTLPGQNVTIILFGDTTLRNAASSVAQQVPPELQQTVSADGTINVRALPSTTSTVLGSLNPGDSITANGRTADNEWIRVQFGEQTGWITSILLSSEGSIESLMVVEPDAEQFGPMQAFYLTTGIGRPSCNEVPDDGMMVQTPQGAGTINLNVNEIAVTMGSTVYFSINENRSLGVAPVEGAARVTSDGVTRTAIAGTRVWIPLDDDYSYAGEPSMPESYSGDEDIADLPYDALEREIQWDDGLDEAEFDNFMEYETVFNNLDLEDIDEVFGYVNENEGTEGFDLPGYLITDLGYTDFDDDLMGYFENDGYDFSGYETFTGDDDEGNDSGDDDPVDDSYDDTEDDS